MDFKISRVILLGFFVIAAGYPGCTCSTHFDITGDADQEGDDAVQSGDETVGSEDAAAADETERPADPPAEEADEPDAADQDEEPGECAPVKIGDDVRITDHAGSSFFPSLVWAGSEYGIAWYDEMNRNEIYFARITPSGEKASDDILVSDPSMIAESASLAWAGSGYGVAWQEFRDSNNEIMMARLLPSGERAGESLRVTDDPSSSTYPSIAWTGSEYAVAWVDTSLEVMNEEIYFARVSASGEKIGESTRITNQPMSSYAPDVVWGGGELGLAWQDRRSGDGDIYFARLSQAGEVTAENAITDDSADSLVVSLEWSGSEYGASWHDGREPLWQIYFARIDAGGQKIGEEVKISSCSVYCLFSSLAWAGSGYGLTWDEQGGDHQSISFARITPLGERTGADLAITAGASNSHQSSLAWSGSEFGVAWQDDRDGNYEIYFARIGCAG